MELYRCELVNNGIIKERFFREGPSSEAVREQLERFQWPKGEWQIKSTDEVLDEILDEEV